MTRAALLIEGCLPETIPQAEQGLASRGDRFVTTSRGPEATAASTLVGRSPQAASDRSAAAHVRALRVKTAAVGAPRGWLSLRREGCQRLASVGVPDVFGTLFYPGAPLGAPSAPRGAGDAKLGRIASRERILLFDIVRDENA